MHPTDKRIAIAFGVWAVFCLALLIGAVYVIAHFVHKGW